MGKKDKVLRGQGNASRRRRRTGGGTPSAQHPRGAVLGPGHPRWDEFVVRLSQAGACDFVEENGELSWRCGGPRRPFATAILKSMVGVDVKRTLAMLEGLGCDCDCRVVLKLDGRHPVNELPNIAVPRVSNRAKRRKTS